MNPNITRRTFFRGATLGAGTVLLAPFLNQLSAAPGSAKPKRFVFVIEGNGFSPMQAQPSTIPRAKHPYGYTNIDRLEDIPLAGHELSEATSPLKAFQDRLTIVQGMSGRICGGGHSITSVHSARIPQRRVRPVKPSIWRSGVLFPPCFPKSGSEFPTARSTR